LAITQKRRARKKAGVMTLVPAPLVVVAMLGALALGLLAGALVNAFADRVVGVDEPVWSASQCHKCLAPLPTPSPFALREFFAPRRACQQCGQRASLRRPLTQLALTILMPIALWRAANTPDTGALGVWALFCMAAASLIALAFIFVVDLEHRLIFDLSIFPLLIALLALVGVFDRRHLLSVAVAAALLGALFLLLYGLGWLLYRQEALGFGDVKLALLVGALVGWPGLTTTLFITVISAGILSMLLLASGAAERRAFIPFGVFMAAAAAFSLLAAPLPW
jgi:leader peptidase (prepilin peptidase)/N-methyltransferase